MGRRVVLLRSEEVAAVSSIQTVSTVRWEIPFFRDQLLVPYTFLAPTL